MRKLINKQINKYKFETFLPSHQIFLGFVVIKPETN